MRGLHAQDECPHKGRGGGDTGRRPPGDRGGDASVTPEKEAPEAATGDHEPLQGACLCQHPDVTLLGSKRVRTAVSGLHVCGRLSQQRSGTNTLCEVTNGHVQSPRLAGLPGHRSHQPCRSETGLRGLRKAARGCGVGSARVRAGGRPGPLEQADALCTDGLRLPPAPRPGDGGLSLLESGPPRGSRL